MTMTSSSAPHLREQLVAEAPKTKSGTDKAPEPVTRKPAVLARAAESGDAAVQKLLAEQEIHRSNGDDEKLDAVTKELAELGYE
jgi:hypothetical protein